MRDPVTLGTVLAEKRRALREADTKVFNRTNSLNEAITEQSSLREEIKAIVAEFAEQGEAILAGENSAVIEHNAIFQAHTAGADFDAASRAAMDRAFDEATTPQSNGAA